MNVLPEVFDEDCREKLMIKKTTCIVDDKVMHLLGENTLHVSISTVLTLPELLSVTVFLEFTN